MSSFSVPKSVDISGTATSIIFVSSAMRKVPKNKDAMTKVSCHEPRQWETSLEDEDFSFEYCTMLLRPSRVLSCISSFVT